MRKVIGGLVLAALVAACGGSAETQKPIAAPLPPKDEPAPTASDTTAPDAGAAASTPATTAPSKEDSAKALVAALQDAINAHDPAKFAANYADDATVVVAGSPEPHKGTDAIAAHLKKALDGFPNAKVAWKRVWVKGDVLVGEWVETGTNSGPMMGMPATEKPVGYVGLSIFFTNDAGKVKEEHRYVDVGTILAQVGASKAKARPVATLPASTEWHWAKADAVDDKALAAVKSTYAAFEKKDDKAFADLNTDDIVWDDLVAPGPTKGKAEAVKQFKAFTAAFPDLKMQATSTWAVEDFVIAEVTTTGTPKGSFMGLVSQTKKPVTLHMADVVQLKDGKAVSGWSYGNSVELLSQFGLMKPPGAAKPDAKADAKPAPKPETKPAAKPDAKPDTKPKK
jgi:steroid delta-isomerase-like uncharacterized protein